MVSTNECQVLHDKDIIFIYPFLPPPKKKEIQGVSITLPQKDQRETKKTCPISVSMIDITPISQHQSYKRF